MRLPLHGCDDREQEDRHARDAVDESQHDGGGFSRSVDRAGQCHSGESDNGEDQVRGPE